MFSSSQCPSSTFVGPNFLPRQLLIRSTAGKHGIFSRLLLRRPLEGDLSHRVGSLSGALNYVSLLNLVAIFCSSSTHLALFLFNLRNDGEHCLHLSALSGNVEIVKLLLEKGADPDVRSTYSQGLRMHPLSWSTYYGRHEIISLLLDHGADPNADFDLGGEFNKEEERIVTALDVVEKILLDMSFDNERKGEFVETRNVLVRNGALRWSTVKDEL